MSKEPGVPATETNTLDYIQPCLWLGGVSAATDVKILQEKKINFILTVDTHPLPTKIYDLKNLIIKYISVNDTVTDDLLSHFDETFQFIENAVQKGPVLVHCFFGVSRSPTIIISYLMKKNGWPVEEAYNFLKSKRACVRPNPGFMAQLKLYQNMSNKINKNNTQYKMFRLYIAAHHVKKFKMVPKYLNDVDKTNLTDETSALELYRCKKCREIISTTSNIIPHMPNEKYSWREEKWTDNPNKKGICEKLYFLEPLLWMENVCSALEGKLHCPNSLCKQKLGSFSWTKGSCCPCGTKVSPAFYLIPSKIDRQMNHM